MIFITDRTIEDVAEAQAFANKSWEDFSDEDKEHWFAGLKGAFNASDLKRIDNNINDLGLKMNNFYRKRLSFNSEKTLTVDSSKYPNVYITALTYPIYFTVKVYVGGTLVATNSYDREQTFTSSIGIYTYEITYYTSHEQTQCGEPFVYGSAFNIESYTKSDIRCVVNDGSKYFIPNYGNGIPLRSDILSRVERINYLLDQIPQSKERYQINEDLLFENFNYETLNSIEKKLEYIYNFLQTPISTYEMEITWDTSTTVEPIEQADVTKYFITTSDYITFPEIKGSLIDIYAKAGTVMHMRWFDPQTHISNNSIRIEWTSDGWRAIAASGFFKFTLYSKTVIKSDFIETIKLRQYYQLY